MQQLNQNLEPSASTSAIVTRGPKPLEVSAGSSVEAKQIADLIAGVADSKAVCFQDTAELPNTAFELKSIFGQFSMHLPAEWRQSVFNQLDQILDEDSWDIDDIIPDQTSWSTLIRLLVWCRFKILPGLGMVNGHPMLSWMNEAIRINITCYPNDLVRWVASRRFGEDVESSIGDTRPDRISEVLHAYNDYCWLLDGR